MESGVEQCSALVDGVSAVADSDETSGEASLHWIPAFSQITMIPRGCSRNEGVTFDPFDPEASASSFLYSVHKHVWAGPLKRSIFSWKCDVLELNSSICSERGIRGAALNHVNPYWIRKSHSSQVSALIPAIQIMIMAQSYMLESQRDKRIFHS